MGQITNERAKQHVKKYACVAPRLLWVRIKTESVKIFNIACYTTVEYERIEVKDVFWDTLNNILDPCDHEERIILSEI